MSNATCQQANLEANAYNTALADSNSYAARSALLANHPVNEQRIAALTAISDFLHGRRSLNSIGWIGQGHRVLMALSQTPQVQAPQSSRQMAVPRTGGFAPESRGPAQSCNSNSDCVGSLRCEASICVDPVGGGHDYRSPAGTYRPESRRAGESCE